MIKYSKCVTAALLLCGAAAMAVPVEYAGAELKKVMALSNVVLQPSDDALVFKARANNKSAIYQQKLNWKTTEIKQVIITAKADKPGQIRFAADTFVDGKRHAMNIYNTVIPDGEFHDYYFDVAGHKNWQGTLTNYELRWFGPENATVEIKKFATSAKTTVKLIGNALKSKVGLFKAKALKSNNEFLAETLGAFGGFHQQKLAWVADEIDSVSFMFKSNKPGTLRYACSLKTVDGKNLPGISLPVQSVPGDDQYHVYTFNLKDNPRFAGMQTNYELRFIGEKGAVIGLKEITAGKLEGSAQKKSKSSVPVTVSSGKSFAAELAGTVLKKNVHPFRLQPGTSVDKNAVTGKSSINTAGGFYQSDVACNTNIYKQVEFTLAADEPGYWNLAVSCTKDGKRATASVSPVAAVPDGRYHTYTFNICESINWQGIATNWELRFLGNEAANLAVKKIRWFKNSNLIPDADRLPVGKEVITGKLMPRAKCQLKWMEGECPGAVMRFYDRNFKEIPNTAVTLEPGQKSVTFTTPEMMVEPRITVNGKAKGFPQLLQISYLPPRETGHTLTWRGKWLWPVKGPGFVNRSVWFERKLDLEAAPDFAVLTATGDDSCFVYVNGKHVGNTRSFSSPGRYDITKYLKKGENIISCRVKNIASWGGFIAMGYAEVAGKTILFDSDGKWTMDTKSNTDRYIPQCKEPALVIGEPSMNPWRARMPYRHAGKQSVLSLVKSEKGKMTVKIESLPVTEVQRLRFDLRRDNGAKHTFTLNISPGSKAWKVGETIELKYALPYVDQGKAELYCVDDFVRLKGNPLLHKFDVKANPPALRRARWAGGPRFMLQMDDEIINPVFWHAPSMYAIKDRVAPVVNFTKNNFRSYRISTHFADFWKPDGTFDFTEFDNSVATLLTRVPDAVFAIQIYSYMPAWWLERNPECISTHENNRPRDLWLDHQALGAKKWQTDGEIPLKALYDHIKKSNYADRVWGVSFTENKCGEWFWTSADATRKRSYAGYSPADLESFKRMLRSWYKTDEELAKAWKKPGLTFDTVTMPSHETARKGTVGELLDPAEDMMMIDFFKFRSLMLAEVLNHFGKFTKEQTDGKWLVGAYYGYFSEMIANPRRNIQSNGHNGFMETVLGPYFDFTHAPLRYTLRKTGQPGALMHVWDPWVLRGKAVFIEQDVRTSYTLTTENLASIVYCGTPDRPQNDIGQFLRSFGCTAATGTLNYWYDLNGSQFDEKAINEAVTFTNDVYMQLGPVKGTTPFEVCVVNSRDSVWYTKYAAYDNPMTIASEVIYKNVNRLAVPFRNLMVYDLLDSKVKLEKLKFYIMHPMVMLTAGQRKKLMERFEREKAVVVWLYSAGASYPTHGPSARNNGDFLGIKFDMKVERSKPDVTMSGEFGNLKHTNTNISSPWFYPVSGFDRVIGRDSSGNPVLVEKKINGSTHYFSTLTDLPAEFYVMLMEKNNIWRYSKGLNKDQFWIGNDVVFLHATGSGDRSLNLPAGTYAKGVAGPVPAKLKSGEKFKVRSGMTYGFQIIKK
ncbi:MAG: hypothetical protein IKD10_03240 [Lentisphaeria bacterium]|nr:hypothetical protein [Lentisphaeria bacterium]